jgi:hypothetical protein
MAPQKVSLVQGAPPVRVRRSRIQGRGVFATRAIPEGERILEYVGTRISSEEADALCPDDEASRRHHTFLFAVDDDLVVDASRGGNAARPSITRATRIARS